MTIQEVVSQFNTTPFIFAGSGVTRRYYDLPDWGGLLAVFAKRISDDDFAYRSYENQAHYVANDSEKMPTIATLIEKDFNKAWFENVDNIRSNDLSVTQAVADGASPFKAEVCAYIATKSSIVNGYEDEIKKLKQISKNNISGVITTNYDLFFETIFEGYKTFVGQDELVFSQLEGIAEIYKIHGSVEKAKSIVINQNDYNEFRKKGKYIAAKLMTIFMEYPIIFLGYSITDSDIRSILLEMVQCLPEKSIPLLQRRFVFVEYDETAVGASVSSLSMAFDEKSIEITIGLASTGYYGLARAVDSEQWYRNIILHDLQYSEDDLLKYVYLELAKQNSWKLPVWYYLERANEDYPDVFSRAPKDYSEIVSNDSIDRNKSAIRFRTMREIWEQERDNQSKAIRLLGFLPYENVSVDDLEMILKEIFANHPNYISMVEGMNKSNIRKLIRIYDYLKYKK